MRLDTINIGEILRNSRENLNLTQEEVGERLGLGRDAIIRIEKGTRKISLDEIKKFLNLYNINIEDLFFVSSNENVEVKGIILAGGSGTRLYPITKGISKQLVPVYDKPMIYYPLSVLIQAGIKDVLIITTREDQPQFKRLLKDGSQLGINLSYEIQEKPNGLAEAFIIGEEFINNKPCAMILGDNIFYGSGLKNELNQAVANANDGYATIFGYEVKDPERFGIMELDANNNVLSVEEKPKYPKSDYAITGLYFYPEGVSDLAKTITPSDRNELEITTLNDIYLKNKKLKARLLNEGYSWFDTGTFDSLLDAANMVRTIENNRDSLICSPEMNAYNNGWISKEKLLEAATEMKKNKYGQKISKIVESKEI